MRSDTPLDLVQATTPPAPEAGYTRLYTKSDGAIYAYTASERLIGGLDTGWITLPLAANWQTYPGWQPPQYRKIGDWVELRGLVQRINSAYTANTPIFTVPLGGPAFNHMFPVVYIQSSGAETVGRADINASTGTLTSGNVIPTSGYIGIYNIRYSLI